MRHWELSGHGARKAMSNWFNTEEAHNQASHLGDYVEANPFVGAHPQKSMSAAVKRSKSLSLNTHENSVSVAAAA